MTQLNKNNQGFAHVALFLVIVLAAIGGAGYYVYTKQKDSKTSDSTSIATKAAQKVAEASCDLEDKDVCKYLSSWKDNKYYKVVTESKEDGTTSGSTYEYVATDKFHMVTTGEYASETISIGNDIYTKDTSDGKWWKQTVKPEEKKKYDAGEDFGTDDTADTAETPESKTTYTLIGKEACGSLTCFKYQVIESDDEAGSKHFIWFDTKDHQLRRQRDETATGYSDSTFSYEKITISAPSPVKELKEGQVIIPGQSEPMDGPTEAELQDIMNQAAEAQDQ